MAAPHSPPLSVRPFEEALRDRLETARRAFLARASRELEICWRELVGQAVAEGVAEVGQVLGAELTRRQNEFSERMLGAVRRLNAAQSQGEWRAAFLEEAASFCRKIQLVVTGDQADGLWPALQGALQAGDTAAALQAAAAALGLPASEKNGKLYPIVREGKLIAVVIATVSDELEGKALELLCWAAGAAPAAPGCAWPMKPSGATAASPEVAESFLSLQEEAIHRRAQRFARVRTAELLLYHAEAVQMGRRNRDLYAALKDQIDAARQQFEREFMKPCSSMTDYYHQELVRSLALNDAGAMGPAYPGPVG